MQNISQILKTEEISNGVVRGIARLLSFCLLVSLALLPLAPVFAEESVIHPATPIDETNQQVLTKEQPPIIEEQTIVSPSEIIEDEDGSIKSELSLNVETVLSIVPATSSPKISTSTSHVQEYSSATTSSSTPTVIPSETEGDSTLLKPSSSSTTEYSSSTVETLDLETEKETVRVTNVEAKFSNVEVTPSPVLNQENRENAPASSTEEVDIPQTEMVNVIINDQNRFMFSKDECVSVGDGSFYCSKGTETPIIQNINRIFAAHNEGGSKEIFLEQDGTIIQITQNDVDDDAPFYDTVSDTIVWHRLIDGRYQIIEYNIKTKKERQLTEDRYNNMQPVRFGKATAWQGWIGNDWEIMLEEDNEILMLTDNTVHDIAPKMSGDYITWQSFEDDAWKVKVYDRNTKRIDTIANADGASAENPRFVLVYDTKSQNGDTETKGYDLASREIVPLSSKPAPVPANIPSPDQTGENRAFVQPIVQIKTKNQLMGDATFNPDPNPEPTASSATSSSDVVIAPYVEQSVDTKNNDATSTEEIVTPNALFDDVIVPIYAEINSPTTSSSEIIDLIITPYVESIETEIADPQGVVATST